MTETQTTAHFDPADFLIVPAKTFEDLTVGDVFGALSRTLTDANASAFHAGSADNHTIHYIGDSFIALTSVSASFLAEVRARDTLYPQLVITDLSTENVNGTVTTRATIHNPCGEQVLEGQHTHLLKLAS